MIEWDQGVFFASLFVTGLVSSLHCVGMCGPILIAFSQVLSSANPSPRPFWQPDFLYYHAGRIWTYGLLGFLAGWAGLELRQGTAALGWQRSFSVGVSVLVILSGIVALGLVPRLKLEAFLTSCAVHASHRRPWLSSLVKERRRVARLLLGAVMGFLPCGLVYTMLLVVSTLPGPLHSALGMVCFGAGTLPALTAVVLGSRAAPTWLRARGTRIAGGLLIAMGVFMLARALLVGPEHVHGHGMP